jgi:GT2 family glycosyltransferase
MPARSIVHAVILSHNSLGTLRETVRRVQSQTDPPSYVVVVDNASTDGTRAFLTSESAIEPVLLERNIGVGAGHRIGWERALDLTPSCDFLWVLEHDSYPESDCLEALLDCALSAPPDPPLGAVAPAIARRTEDLVATPPPTSVTVAHRFSFNGVLIARGVPTTIGFPREDFFVGLEDREYARRVRTAGFSMVRARAARVVHQHTRNRQAGVRPSVARQYYSTRNGLYLRLHEIESRMSVFGAVVMTLRGAAYSLYRDRQRTRRVCSRVTALYDAVRGRMGRRTYWFLEPEAT